MEHLLYTTYPQRGHLVHMQRTHRPRLLRRKASSWPWHTGNLPSLQVHKQPVKTLSRYV